MTLHLPDYKMPAIKADCHNLVVRREVSVRELSQLCLNTGHFPGPFALSLSPTSETPSTGPTQRLRRDYSPIERGDGRAILVASPPECMERMGYHPSPFSRPDNRNGHVESGLGRSVPSTMGFNSQVQWDSILRYDDPNTC